MPETSETATQFVLDGDTRLSELNAQLAAAEASEDGMAIAHAHVDLADAGAHDAVPRAQALILGLGFKVSELEHPVNSFGRLAHAPAAGARADVPLRPAAAGRAHQPLGPGRPGLAGSLAQALPRHPGRDQP